MHGISHCNCPFPLWVFLAETVHILRKPKICFASFQKFVSMGWFTSVPVVFTHQALAQLFTQHLVQMVHKMMQPFTITRGTDLKAQNELEHKQPMLLLIKHINSYPGGGSNFRLLFALSYRSWCHILGFGVTKLLSKAIFSSHSVFYFISNV